MRQVDHGTTMDKKSGDAPGFQHAVHFTVHRKKLNGTGEPKAHLIRYDLQYLGVCCMLNF
jgi:hypothetical protein